jgi:hypothetical protein
VKLELATVAAVVTFAGSIAGFHLTTAAGAPGPDVLATPPSGPSEPVRAADACPGERLWEEA